MSTCLGLYIEENIIKYAKVSKDKNDTKVENYGVVFYDNIDAAIKQIIEETYSYKVPISTNLTNENYNFFDVFAMLNKKDLPKAIKTEFESYCSTKNLNPNVFERRYALTPNVDDEKKLRVIYVIDNKLELNKNIQKFNSYRLQNVVPLSLAISGITQFEPRERSLIVNIEEKTVVTTVLDQNIYSVKTLDVGSEDILEKINLKENSLQKSYEICKETTIYTSEGRELTDIDTGYLEDIMPVLYQIVGEIQKIANETTDGIDKVYITGTGALINNVDLYFEEYLDNVKCEVLRPDFIKLSPEVNIKDYVEVNSAIALALSGLGEGISGMNFKTASLTDKLSSKLGTDKVKEKTKKESDSKLANLLANDFSVPLDSIERGMLRSIAGLLILLLTYSGFSLMLKKQIDDKMREAVESADATRTQIQLVDKDVKGIQNKTSEYSTKIKNLQEINSKIEATNRVKKAIPILLNKLMYIMPDEVQITSIQNTTDTHIEILAQSASYAQLGYLTTNIKLSGVLNDVISTAGQQSNNLISIKIEGDLP